MFHVHKPSSKPFNPLSANPPKMPKVCDHFVGLALKGLKSYQLKKKKIRSVSHNLF